MTQKIQCRSLKLITNNYHSDYYKFPLNETGNSTMEMKGLCTLALEIFKTLSSLNLNFMKDFNFPPYSTHKKHDIFAHSQNTSNYGDKILRSLEPHT